MGWIETSSGDTSSSSRSPKPAATSRLALRRSWIQASRTEPSNSRLIGIASMHMLIGSWLGVATAAKTKIRKIAIRCHLISRDAGSTPTRLSIDTSSGSSKAAPKTSSIDVTKLT